MHLTRVKAILLVGGAVILGGTLLSAGLLFTRNWNASSSVGSPSHTTDTSENNTPSTIGIAGQKLDPSTLMDFEWDSRRASIRFANMWEIVKALSTLPLQGAETITSEQRKRLLRDVAGLCLSIGTNNPKSYFDQLRKTGEVPRPDIVAAFRKNLTDNYKISPQSVPKDPYAILELGFRKSNLQSHWDRLVPQGSKIEIRATSNPDEPVGAKLFAIRQAITTFGHLFNPPTTMADLIKAYGSVKVAQITIFIRHDDSLGGIVRPYIIRFYYDPQAKVWRPSKMDAFQNRKEHFESDFLF